MFLRKFKKHLLSLLALALILVASNAAAAIHSNYKDNSFQINVFNQSDNTWVLKNLIVSGVQLDASFTDLASHASTNGTVIINLTEGQLFPGGVVLIHYQSQDTLKDCVFTIVVSANGPGDATSVVQTVGNNLKLCKVTQTGDAASGQFNLSFGGTK